MNVFEYKELWDAVLSDLGINREELEDSEIAEILSDRGLSDNTMRLLAYVWQSTPLQQDEDNEDRVTSLEMFN
jgi:hypothetical protein